MPRPTDDGRGETPTLIAHQGFADVYPGNTLAAMRGAASDGAAMIELDVQCCADGEVVVFHDPRLDESTDKGGRVTETPCEVVLDAEVRNSGETIPTLEAVLGEIPTDVGVNVELKNLSPPSERRAGRPPTTRATAANARRTNASRAGSRSSNTRWRFSTSITIRHSCSRRFTSRRSPRYGRSIRRSRSRRCSPTRPNGPLPPRAGMTPPRSIPRSAVRPGNSSIGPTARV